MTEEIESASVTPAAQTPSDSALPTWFASLPEKSRPYVALARLERPIGFWLLYLPCLMGLFQMRIPTGLQWIDLFWVPAFAIGALAMRAAGCTWNDIRDQDLDAQVSRTASRPLPSGAVTTRQAYMFLAALMAIGLIVWLFLPLDAKLIAIAAAALAVAYPMMKRITQWPQAALGFTFATGVLIGAATGNVVTGASVLLYLGIVCWVVAYDTIYALQDVEDDALIGVKSTALLFGDKVLTATFAFFLFATMLIFLGAYFAGAGRIGAILSLGFLGHAIWQISTLGKPNGHSNALMIFKSNKWTGAILVAGFFVAAILGQMIPLQ